MAKQTPTKGGDSVDRAAPIVRQRGAPLQPFGTLRNMPIGLSEEARRFSCERLNHLLADTITLRDLYKKHHWQLSGPTFYQLHLLFDEHYEQQAKLVDELAERIQLLGGVSLAMAADVADETCIERAPKDAEHVPVQISRLLEAHEMILKEARDIAGRADELGDDGTNDLLVSSIVRTNEMQTWFVASHVVEMPLVREQVPQLAQGQQAQLPQGQPQRVGQQSDQTMHS